MNPEMFRENPINPPLVKCWAVGGVPVLVALTEVLERYCGSAVDMPNTIWTLRRTSLLKPM